MNKWIALAVVIVVAGLAFAGGAIYQYSEDKPIIGAQEAEIKQLSVAYTALLARYYDFFDYSANVREITVEQAVIWLDRAAYSHEHNLFDDDPDNDEFN